MNKIKIKNWKTRKIIFSYECENNTYRKTVEAAVRKNISLAYADLSCADLSNSKLLSFVNLSYADLTNANLSGADLYHADLCNANLYHANLSHADLRCASLYRASLYQTDLSYANLNSAVLYEADLNHAILNGAELKQTCLNNAYLSGADLSNAKFAFCPTNLPNGEFIGWKKVREYSKNNNRYIIKLKILADSKRSRGTSDKCRCDKALVLEIQDLDGNKLDLTEITNYNYAQCTYKVGEIVYSDSWDENRFNECSHGIHFFLDREMAVNY